MTNYKFPGYAPFEHQKIGTAGFSGGSVTVSAMLFDRVPEKHPKSVFQQGKIGILIVIMSGIF